MPGPRLQPSYGNIVQRAEDIKEATMTPPQKAPPEPETDSSDTSLVEDELTDSGDASLVELWYPVVLVEDELLLVEDELSLARQIRQPRSATEESATQKSRLPSGRSTSQGP